MSIEVTEHHENDFEHVVLETRKATVTPIRSDCEWLARDIFSTPYATVLRDDS